MQDSSRIGKHATPAQREKILQAYRRTQLTRRDFAAQSGISVSTLAGWLRRADDSGKGGSRFVAVPNLLAAAPVAAAYRLQWPGGLSLEVRAGFAPGELAALSQLLPTP